MYIPRKRIVFNTSIVVYWNISMLHKDLKKMKYVLNFYKIISSEVKCVLQICKNHSLKSEMCISRLPNYFLPTALAWVWPISCSCYYHHLHLHIPHNHPHHQHYTFNCNCNCNCNCNSKYNCDCNCDWNCNWILYFHFHC